MYIFKGAGTALVTPFNKKNQINFNEFEKLIDFQLENKIQALIFLGTTGEASTLSEKEKMNVAEFAIAYVKGRVPVILGAGGNNTSEVIKRSKKFAKLGCSALLQVTPYYNKATQNGLIEHYSQIAKTCSLPQILYNVPSRTGVTIEPETVKQLSKIPNIVGLKEAGGNLGKLTQMLSEKPKDFAIYSGEDENIFTTLALGGQGVISVLANIMPKETSLLCQQFFAGDAHTSLKLQFDLLKIIKLLFSEVNPIPVKQSLNIMGFNVGKPRLPLTPLSKENTEKLKKILKKLNL